MVMILEICFFPNFQFVSAISAVALVSMVVDVAGRGGLEMMPLPTPPVPTRSRAATELLSTRTTAVNIPFLPCLFGFQRPRQSPGEETEGVLPFLKWREGLD
jgi:hypothetical protein